jgi:hypothetical protein
VESGAQPPSCVPAIPKVAWTSPYASWSRGIPTDPSFFPIGVWLQLPSHAMELANLGVNIYIGNNAGTDSLTLLRRTSRRWGPFVIVFPPSAAPGAARQPTRDGAREGNAHGDEGVGEVALRPQRRAGRPNAPLGS